MTNSISTSQNVFEKWNEEVGDLISNLSSSNFPVRLQQSISRVVPFKDMMIFGYRTKGRPLDLYNIGDIEHRKIIVQNYIAGCYMLDPFYHEYKKGYESRFYALSEVIPDNFPKSDYNLSHYAQTRIYDEVVLYIDLGNGLTAATSLTRDRTQPKFSKREIATLNSIASVISSFIRHYWIGSDFPEAVTNEPQTDPSLRDHIQRAFNQFGCSLLTKRESEVVGLILRGYSSTAIAEQLTISPGTVKIHRKNAYQKLDISSQSELFSVFIKSLSEPASST